MRLSARHRSTWHARLAELPGLGDDLLAHAERLQQGLCADFLDPQRVGKRPRRPR
jgi:hypothetical protein